MDLKTGEITKYISARKAALALNISNSTVMKKLRENQVNLPYIKIDLFYF